MRNLSKINMDWWDYTTLDEDILKEAANIKFSEIDKFSRKGFSIKIYDTLEEFYLAEALEYIYSWRKSTSDNPFGICGPIGPTEQLPLVAQIVNDLEIDIKNAHFWAMDEWFFNDKELPSDHSLSFKKANMDLCFNKINKRFRMSDENLHFLKADNLSDYTKSYDSIKCAITQGGQGEVKHWAFNDPVKRIGIYKACPPSFSEYSKLSARVVDLHPLTIIQNARTSRGGGQYQIYPYRHFQ